MSNYQLEYASNRPQMYDVDSRKLRAKRIIKTLENFFGTSKPLNKMTTLDVGSSTGILDYELAPHFKKIIGIDIDKSAVVHAKNVYKHKNLEFRTADAMKLPFPDNSFDIVICAQVYEHVPNAQKLFFEIERVLKKGGVCYFAALNSLWPVEPHYNLPFLSILPKPIANKYLQLFRNISEYYETPRTYWELKAMLASNFTIVDYTPLILSQPTKFGYKIPNFLFPLVKLSAPITKYFTPTFFWLLVK